jgi:hypothetical protein
MAIEICSGQKFHKIKYKGGIILLIVKDKIKYKGEILLIVHFTSSTASYSPPRYDISISNGSSVVRRTILQYFLQIASTVMPQHQILAVTAMIGAISLEAR